MKAEIVPGNGDPPISVTKDITVVGRGDFCDIQIADPSLSKRHAVLIRTEGLLLVRDLISTNGTKVNGQRVMWAALMPNDRLTLGRYKLKIYLGPDSSPSPSEISRRRDGAPVAEVTGFAPPTPIGTLFPPTSTPGSTDPDAEVSGADQFVIDDEDEFVIDLQDG